MKKKDTIKRFIMQAISGSAMFCAVMVVNFFCPFFTYQEKEPASVRKLRKF